MAALSRFPSLLLEEKTELREGHTQVNAYFPRGKKLLALSLFQTLILLLFNDAPTLSYGFIKDATGIG